MTRHSEHDSRRPLFVLVGSYGFGARGLPSFGPIPATVGDVGIVGLPFGRGDPATAHLERRQWAVVQIDDADDVREVRSPSGAPAAVEFHKGAVLFNGSPRGALERLLLLGARPNEMSAQLVLQDATGRAEGGAYSVAIAGEFGIARAGASGDALAEYGGIAIAGERGTATVEKAEGLAVVDAVGAARVGEDGIAIARGRGATAIAGNSGLAVAMADAGSVEVGAHGQAIVLGPLRKAVVGDHGMIVTRQAVEAVSQICLGRGALAILRWREPATGKVELLVARGGVDGVEPDEPYVFFGGALVRKTEFTQEQGQLPPAERTSSALGDLVSEPVLETGDAGECGLAIIEANGRARAGTLGIAISTGKRYGICESGSGGLAIGRGRFKIVSAGAGGAAIATSYGGILKAGDDGIALGAKGQSFASKDGIAIALDGIVSGGPGCLLVVRTRTDAGDDSICMGRVGTAGISPNTQYNVHKGRLVVCTE